MGRTFLSVPLFVSFFFDVSGAHLVEPRSFPTYFAFPSISGNDRFVAFSKHSGISRKDLANLPPFLSMRFCFRVVGGVSATLCTLRVRVAVANGMLSLVLSSLYAIKPGGSFPDETSIARIDSLPLIFVVDLILFEGENLTRSEDVVLDFARLFLFTASLPTISSFVSLFVKIPV